MATLVRLAVLTLCAAFALVTCGGPLLDRLSPPPPPVVTVSGGREGPLIAPPQAVNSGPVTRPTVAGAGAAPQPRPTLPVAGSEVTPAPLVGQMAPVGQVSPGLAEQIDAYLRSLVEGGAFSGAVLVAKDGQVLLSQGYGKASYQPDLPATAQTRFRLASVTKQFTALGILILAAQGKLNPLDSICVYLADCPPAWQPVTVHQLLNHTSGIPDYTDFLDFADYETTQVTPDQLIARFRDLPLAFAPGSLYDYCNSNYLLLAVIIERVAGRPFGDFLQDRIFAPLGMANSGLDPGDGSPLGGTRGYVGVDQPAIPINTSTLFGAGDLYSTVEDLYRWDQALYTEQLLPAKWRDLMFTPGFQDYGYGWVIRDWNSHKRIAHQGNMSGASTFIARYPADRLTVIVLSNNEWANSVGIADQITAMILN